MARPSSCDSRSASNSCWMCRLKRSTCSCVRTPRWSRRGGPWEPWDDPLGILADRQTNDQWQRWIPVLFIAQSLGGFIGSIQILSDHFGVNDSHSARVHQFEIDIDQRIDGAKDTAAKFRDWRIDPELAPQPSWGSKIWETSRDSLCTKISRTGPDEINDSEEKIASHSHHPHHPHSIHVHSTSQEKPAISPQISRLRYLFLPEAHCTVGRRADVPSSASVIAAASRMDLPPGPTTVEYVPSSYGSCGTIKIWFYMLYRWFLMASYKL